MSVPPNVQDSTLEQRQTPAPATTLDAYGLTCGSLERLIANHLRALAPEGRTFRVLAAAPTSDRPGGPMANGASTLGF